MIGKAEFNLDILDTLLASGNAFELPDDIDFSVGAQSVGMYVQGFAPLFGLSAGIRFSAFLLEDWVGRCRWLPFLRVPGPKNLGDVFGVGPVGNGLGPKDGKRFKLGASSGVQVNNNKVEA